MGFLATVWRDDRQRIALVSVGLAAFLSAMKLLWGILTGSLGIISEGLHSSLDLTAAIITFFAVKEARKPPDPEHRYGHGKIESFSALIESGLLFLTCAWIIYEAVSRLFFKDVHVEVRIHSFLVMGISIVVDVTRARTLRRAARRFRSLAFEADALHFSSDVLSSAAVILGLTALAAGVEIADPLAALAVAGVIIVASIRLGKKTSLELMDTAPKEIVDRVARILRETPGVEGFDQLRVRTSGITHFVDVTIAIDRTCSFEQANQISRTLEARIKQEVGDADVVIHATPIALPREDLALKVRMLARNFPEIIDLHSMYVQEVGGRYVVEAHVSLEGNLPLARADAIAKAFEEKVRRDLVEVQEVLTHIDAVSPFQGSGEEITGQAPELIEQVRQVVEPLIPQWITEYRNLRITRIDHTHSLSLECLMNPDLSIEEAHSIAAQLEFLIREKVPGVGRIIVHAAPRPPIP